MSERDGQTPPIPLFRPWLGEEEERAVLRVLRSHWLGRGAETDALEAEFAAWLGVAHAIGVNSCTSGLLLALKGMDLPAGSEVLIPAITFISTAAAVLHNGLRPVMVDVDDAVNLDLADLETRITERSSAVIPVHFGGQPVDLDRLRGIADKHGLRVLEDAAHAAGARWDGRLIGAHGNPVCFSFSPVKNLSTCDGGMVVTEDEALMRAVRSLAGLGKDSGSFERYIHNRAGWMYEIERLGYKMEMNDLAAAIGRVQLAKLEESNRRRAERAQWYREELDGLEAVRFVPQAPNAQSSWHLLLVLAERRGELYQHLKENGVVSSVHYRPLYQFKPLAEYSEPLPRAEAIYQRLLSLPLFPDLTREQVAEICGLVRGFYQG